MLTFDCSEDCVIRCRNSISEESTSCENRDRNPSGRTRETFQALAKKHASNDAMQREIAEATTEDELVRKYGEEYVGYMTFIMKRP